MFLIAILASLQGPTIDVDVSGFLGPVNRGVFGNNLVAYQKGGYGNPAREATDEGEGIWDPVKRQPVPGMIALAKQSGMTFARWPGGCATHLYEWKRTIGAVEKRPDQRFGLPEYLETCKAIGAQPLISVSEYFGKPQDAADLVEYLNAPDDGRHPWASKRASDGHPMPWGVKWFEFGNESDHGPHRSNDDIGKIRPAYTGDEYGSLYLATRRAMRAIDPTIKVGAVISTGFQAIDGWPSQVAQRAGADLDFAIFHSYLPSVGENAAPPERLFPNALAGEDQIQNYLDSLREMLASKTSRPVRGQGSTPIAVTEFNGGFVQEMPVPYRFSLGDALIVADMLHIWLKPQNGVVFANFWEFPNEYWGMVRGYASKGDALVVRPPLYAVQLFAQHLGAILLPARVSCPNYSTPGDPSIGIEPHLGAGSKGKDLETTPIIPAWQITPVAGVTQDAAEGALRVDFHDPGDLNYYHAGVQIDARPNCVYRLTGWIKTEGLPSGNGASFQIGDARGWLVTHSAQVGPSVTGTSNWRKVDVVYSTLEDTKAVQILARRLSGTGQVHGTAWYKNLSLTRIIPKSLAAVPVLSVTASRDTDGKRLFLIVTNKDLTREMPAKLVLRGFRASSTRAWTLTGPTIEATNEVDPNTVGIHPLFVSGSTVHFPPRSVTAVEVNGSLAPTK